MKVYRKPWVIIGIILAMVTFLGIFFGLYSKQESEEVISNESNTDESVDGNPAVERYNLGDLDGNGVEEFMEVSEEKSLHEYGSYMSFYFNGDKIYEYDDSVRILCGEAEYIDLDMDGEYEIFLNFLPEVNSAPLQEYIVLKRVGNEWKALEMIHGETMLDNAFPITVEYGKEKNTMVLKCEGTQEQIVYDFTAYFEGEVKYYKEQGENGMAENYERIIEGDEYKEGDCFGGVASWGIWQIESAQYDGENCLIAKHGILGPMGSRNQLGNLYIYFNYNKEGRVNILNMEFRECLWNK